MRYSFFIVLLSSTFLVSSLEANPPFDPLEEAPRSFEHNRVSPVHSVPEDTFQSSHFFGLEALKKLDTLNKGPKRKWKKENQERLEMAVRAKLSNNLEEAKKIFLNEVVQRSCPTSMRHLGMMAENENDFEKALSWYVGSFWMGFLQEKENGEIKKSWEQLTKIIDKVPSAQNFYQLLAGYFPDNVLFSTGKTLAKGKIFSRAKRFFHMLLNAHTGYDVDEDLNAYIMGLAKWISGDQPSEELACFGTHFEVSDPVKAGYCSYLSRTLSGQAMLSGLIDREEINYDQDGKFFAEEDRYNVLGKILWRVMPSKKLQDFEEKIAVRLGELIRDGQVTRDAAGKQISEKKNMKLLLICSGDLNCLRP